MAKAERERNRRSWGFSGRLMQELVVTRKCDTPFVGKRYIIMIDSATDRQYGLMYHNGKTGCAFCVRLVGSGMRKGAR